MPVDRKLVAPVEVVGSPLFRNTNPACVPRFHGLEIELDDAVHMWRKQRLRRTGREQHARTVQHGSARLQIAYESTVAHGRGGRNVGETGAVQYDQAGVVIPHHALYGLQDT